MFERNLVIPLLWLLLSLSAGLIAGRLAFVDPPSFSNAVDMLATIISILTGVSLAVIAVLISPFSVGVGAAKDEFEAERMNKVVNKEESLLAVNQVLFFLLFLFLPAFPIVFDFGSIVQMVF